MAERPITMRFWRWVSSVSGWHLKVHTTSQFCGESGNDEATGLEKGWGGVRWGVLLWLIQQHLWRPEAYMGQGRSDRLSTRGCCSLGGGAAMLLPSW